MSKMLENKMKVTEVKNNNEYLICFKNIIGVLKIFGIFPFINLNEATKFGRLLSMTITIISLSLYAVANTNGQIQLYHIYRDKILQELNFVYIVRFILVVIIRMILLTFPFLTWGKTEHLKKYWHNWMVFQVEIEKFTKISYKSPVRNKIQRIFVLLSVCLITIVLIYQTHGQSSLMEEELFQRLYQYNTLVNISMFWVMNNMYTNAVAKKIVNLVQQALLNDKPANLSRLIDLWIMLCDLNEEFIHSHSIIFLTIFSQVIMATVLNIFVAAIILIYFEDKSLALPNICGTLVSIMILVAQCESANSVGDELVDKLEITLLSQNMNFKNQQSLIMISSFLHTIDTRNPKISFSRCTVVDRSTVTTVLRTIINFLVILKQFNPS